MFKIDLEKENRPWNGEINTNPFLLHIIDDDGAQVSAV